MRALLVVNPTATTTTQRSRDVLIRALRSEVDVTVAVTRRRSHAVDLAREATETGIDLVVALGGDGTVNEVVNGLMAGAARPAEQRPALAVVPGGSTNVFARALGLPNQWAEATGVILEALRERRERVVGLGTADDRYFTFCAGLGLDAAVIRRVERERLRGKVSTPALYVRAAVGLYLRHGELRRPAISLEQPGEESSTGFATVIVQNTAPWTFLGDRPINPNPAASFDTGLDLFALRELRVPGTARTVAQLLRSADPRGSQAVRLHDVAEFSLLSSQPQPFQVDGDYLGEREKVRFASVPRALRVIC